MAVAGRDHVAWRARGPSIADNAPGGLGKLERATQSCGENGPLCWVDGQIA